MPQPSIGRLVGAGVLSVGLIVVGVSLFEATFGDRKCASVRESALADLDRSDHLLSQLDQMTQERKCQVYADRAEILKRLAACAKRPVTGKPQPMPAWESSENAVLNLAVARSLREDCNGG